MRQISKTGVLALVALVAFPCAAFAQYSAEGALGIGYTVLDETGNRSVAVETYDVYEKVGVSLRHLHVYSPHHYELSADLENVNLNNRLLSARLSRPGCLSISGRYNETRRIYDFDGRQEVSRTQGNLDAVVIPHRWVKLLGGYLRTAREGASLALGGAPFSDIGEGPGADAALIMPTDHAVTAYYLGAQLRYQKSMLETRYRQSAFSDDLDEALDRKGKQLRFQMFTPVPRLEQILLTGGFSHGWTEIESRGDKRTENLGWGNVAWTVHPRWVLSSRLMFSRTDNEATERETDNAVSNLFVTWKLPGKAETSVGYEFRSQDDLIDRTETHGFVVRGLARPLSRLLVRWQMATARKDNVTGATLVGDEESIRHRCELRYDHPGGHQVMIGYRDRVREFEQLDAEANYRTIVSALTVHLPNWAEGSGSYAYSKGDYLNVTSAVHFEQHLVWAHATSVQYYHVRLDAGLAYLRTRLNTDVEKIIFSFGVTADLTRGYELLVGYNAHNYDDFLGVGRYYTANVIRVNIQKHFNF